MTAALTHIVCVCSYAAICPWDRFCAGCGKALMGELGELPDGVKVDNGDRVSFRIQNRSTVTIHVTIPHIAADTTRAQPPPWLKYNPRTGNAEEFDLGPGAERSVGFDVDRGVIEAMLREPGLQTGRGGAARASTSFPLHLFVDSDYRRQRRVVSFSLLGQADLRPAAIEFPSIWLTNPAALTLPLRVFNASGEEMVIERLRTFCPDAAHSDIVDALFPPAALARLRTLRVPAGQHLDLAVGTGPIATVLETLTKDRGPRFSDPHAARRSTHWIERWPTLSRVRFVVEATLRSVGADPVPVVRSLVVLTLVRPPILRDASPDDDLWKRANPIADGPARRLEPGVHNVGDGRICELIADLTNDSAMPVTVERVSSDRRWAEVYETPTGVIVPPGATYNIRVRVDMAKRDPSEMQAGLLDAKISLVTSPPTPLGGLDAIQVRSQSTVVLPGCLGIDFGTSNCAVCYMPAGDPPDSPRARDPVALPLDFSEGGGIRVSQDNLASVLMRRLSNDPQRPDPEFAFGYEADQLADGAPDNTIRGLKRLLGLRPDHVYPLRTSDPNCPVVKYKISELASRMLRHILHQAQSLAPGSTTLGGRLIDAAERSQDPHHPSPEDLKKATAFRFAKAVFNHPVDASEGLKRTLYDCAVEAGLASERGADGVDRILDYPEFARTRLIDESTAAISHFVFQHPSVFNARDRHILCIDMGGGTTDISAMTFKTRERYTLPDGTSGIRRPLRLIYRKGINDFAGMDLDRAIALRILVARADDKLQVKGRGRVMKELLDLVLQGYATDVIERYVADRMGRLATSNEIQRVCETTVRAASALRAGAEEAKKRAGADPEGKMPFNVPGECPIVEDGGTLSTLTELLPVEISFRDVNALMQELVRARLPVLDEVVQKARWGWAKVDILLFTGQTSRAPAIREAILDHVRRARGGTLPQLVLPPPPGAPGSTPGANGDARADTRSDIIYFDPKMCVPAGAALRGYGGPVGDQIQLLLMPGAAMEIRADGPGIRKGDPLPAFTTSESIPDTDDAACVVVYVGATQVVANVPPADDDEALYTLVLDEQNTLWVLRAGASAAPPAPDVPAGLAKAIKDLPAEFHRQYAMSGPVVTWFACVHPTPGVNA